MTSLKILELRDFRRLWLGQAVSQFGDSLYFLIFLYMVEKLTGDPRLVGVVVAAQALPYLVLSFWAGALADRIDRRLLMLGSDVVSAAIMLAFAGYLAFQPKPPFAAILVVALLLATVNVFFAPAKSAAIPRLVPPERLTEANSLSMATQNLMPLIGLGLSASVLGIIEARMPNAFFLTSALLNGLTFVYSASCLARLPSIIPQRNDHEPTSTWKDSVDGLKYIVRSPFLRMLMFMQVGLNFFIGPFLLVYVAVNKSWFGGQYWTLGTFEASFTAAMLLAALVAPRLTLRRPGLAFAWGSIFVGIFVVFMGWSPSFWPFLLWNVACGLVIPFIQLPTQTYVMQTVEDAYMGRVMSSLAMVGMVVIPIANLIAGFALNRFGPEVIFFGMGGGMVAFSLLGLASPAFAGARIKDPVPVLLEETPLPDLMPGNEELSSPQR